MSADFNNLTLRNLTAYNPDGSFVSDGNILTIQNVPFLDTGYKLQIHNPLAFIGSTSFNALFCASLALFVMLASHFSTFLYTTFFS